MILGCASLFVPAGVRAQIVAPGGRTLFNRAVMVRSFVRLDNFAEGAPNLGVRRLVNPYAVVWGAYPHLNLTFVAPLVSLDSNASDLPARDFTTTGFGDGFLFARYDLLRRNVRGGFTRFSPEVGVKVPSGGVFGTGSTDPIGALIFSHVRDPHWLVADAEFTYTTTGDDGFRGGNRWRYDLAYLFRVFPLDGLGTSSVLLVLELNGEHERRARLDGAKLPDTGGDLLFLSPGVEFLASNRLVLEFSSPIPVARQLNGTQLRPTSSFILGVRWLF